MKKNLIFASLLLCMFAVFSFSFVGCSDDADEFDYPEGATLPQGDEAKPFKATRLKGTLKYDDIEQKWIIEPETKNIICLNNYSKCTYFITNMADEYESLAGEVVYSGIVKLLYAIGSENTVITESYFSIELSELSSAEPNSRSLSNDSLTFYCLTPAPTPPSWFFTRSFTELSYNTSYNFRAFVHVVRPTSGIVDGYIKENVASVTIENLNDYYAEANITFSLLGSDYIDDDKYINMTMEQCGNSSAPGNGLFTENSKSNAIDIYVLSSAPNLEAVGAMGYSNGIPGKGCLVVKTSFMDATIAHEIGHCLGLYHTHQGTANLYHNNYYDGGRPELVNGSNSTIAGDYITDTPADPLLWNLCTYSGIVTDANGDSYNPDPENIMSYSRCQSKHTQKQIERIYETIDHSTMLQALCEKIVTNKTTTPLAIGNETSYTLSVDAPDNYIVTWDVTCKSCTSKTASTTYSETLIGRSVNLTNRYPNASSQRYDIEITIRTHIHDYEFKIYKTLLKISNLATTGTLTWGTETNGGTINLSNPQNSSPIIVRKGENLSFIYTDACGASSYTDNDLFSYNIYSPSGFTPITGANHIFRCESYATTTTSGRMMLSFTYPGSSTIMQLPIQILAGTNTLSSDSLKLEESYMQDERLINEQ